MTEGSEEKIKNIKGESDWRPADIFNGLQLEDDQEVEVSDLGDQIATQNSIDQNKIQEILEKLNSISWKEFWKKEGLNSPARKDVFPNGEDKRKTDEEIVAALNEYFDKDGATSNHNMSGIDSTEFPEIIDRDIRAVCQKLNESPFLKTREGCGGHESDKLGEISNIGYSEPYLIFYAEEENQEFHRFTQQLDKKMEQFKLLDLPGMENVVFDKRKEDWPIETKGIGMYRYEIRIVPTREWCEQNNKKYIERPTSPGAYPDWCLENGFEYSENESDKSRQKWGEAKKEYWKKMEEFGNEYGNYFRSAEARKLRDEFFKVFEYENNKQ
jgi:hypothetical protein